MLTVCRWPGRVAMTIAHGPIVQTAWVTREDRRHRDVLHRAFRGAELDPAPGHPFVRTRAPTGQAATSSATSRCRIWVTWQLELIQPIWGANIYTDFPGHPRPGTAPHLLRTGRLRRRAGQRRGGGSRGRPRGSLAGGVMDFAYLDGAAAGVPTSSSPGSVRTCGPSTPRCARIRQTRMNTEIPAAVPLRVPRPRSALNNACSAARRPVGGLAALSSRPIQQRYRPSLHTTRCDATGSPLATSGIVQDLLGVDLGDDPLRVALEMGDLVRQRFGVRSEDVGQSEATITS